MNHTRVINDPDRAARILRSGGIVAVPTETVYGLAAVITDEVAVGRVFTAKGRPAGHPLIVHVASIEDAGSYGLLDDRAAALADRFWPGPLTLLVERTPLVPDAVTGGRDTVAIRMPDHAMTLEVIRRCGDAIVAPSANRFGHVSPTTARHVVDDLDGLIDAILDGGPCPVGVESTIVDCTGPALQLLRPGAVSAADIAEATGCDVSTADGPSRAPGMLVSHYSPAARVLLFGSADEAATWVASAPAGHPVRVIGSGITLREYAATLYSMLRAADEDGIMTVCAVMPPGDGLAAAIRDRLTKAAADTAS